jgi:hypothetical protein
MTNTPDQHSDIVGGSTAARRLACPPSYRLEQSVPKPDDDGSVFAREGTCLHELMAMAITDGIEPADLIPFTFKSRDGWEHTIDQDVWDEKGEAALYMLDSLVAHVEEGKDSQFELIAETRVAFPGIEGAFGTSDVIGHCGGEIFIMDFKFGQGLVDARENAQMSFYAVGALETIPEFFPFEITDNTKVTFAILQPAAGAPSIWTTTVSYLDDFAARLRAAVVLAKDGRGDVTVGDHCKFARCQSICPKRVGAAQVIADRLAKLQALTAKGNAPVESSIDIGPALAEILDLAALVQPMLDSASALAIDLAERGTGIPGYVLKPKRAGARKWADEEEAATFLEGCTIEPYKRVVISPAVAEKMLKGAGIDLPDQLVETPAPSGNNLVRVDKYIDMTVADAAAKIARRLG